MLFVLDQRLWQWQRILCAILIFLALFGYANIRFSAAQSQISYPLADLASNKVRFCGQIASVQGSPDKRLRITLKSVHAEGKNELLKGNCLWTWENPAFSPMPGQTVCLSKSIKPVGGFANYEAQSYDKSLFAQNIYWRTFSRNQEGRPELGGQPNYWSALRQKLKNDFLAALALGGQPTQAQAVLLALLFGDRFYLLTDTAKLFSLAAIAHSLALSGQHLAIAGLAAWLVIAACARLWPQMYLVAPKCKWIFCASAIFACIYLWLGNAPPSLQRAAFMLFIAGLLLWRHSLFTSLDILALALFLILLLNPLAICDLGLQLSALSVATIFLIYPAISRIFPVYSWKKTICWNILLRGLWQIAIISLSIQIVLMPIALVRFHQFGLFFPMNLVWLPVLACLVLPLAVLGLIFASVPFLHCLAALTLKCAALPCAVLIESLQILRNFGILQEPAVLTPAWPALPAGILLVCGLAWLFGANGKIRNASKLLLLGLILLAIGPIQRLAKTFDTNIYIDAMDAGQGQAILLTLPGPMRLLLDGSGGFSRRFDPGESIVGPFLTENAAPGLNAVINSHPDIDHLGGLFYILRQFAVGSVFHNGRNAKGENGEIWRDLRQKTNARVLAAGDTIILGNAANGLALEVLQPQANVKELEGNGASLVLRLTRFDEGLAIFTGDADKISLKQIAGKNIAAKIVFAPHHGSDKNMLAAFYEAARPEIVIACCGYFNRWHYPGKKLRAWLQRHEIPLLDTGNYGRITITITPLGHISMSTIKRYSD